MKVAIGIIPDNNKRVLITQRPMHASHGGFWEFPGGKLEDNELAEQALIRELKEELGINIIDYRFLGEIKYQYPHYLVHLFVFYIDSYQGTPKCMEDQLNMKWTEVDQLDPSDFPKANHAIIDMIL